MHAHACVCMCMYVYTHVHVYQAHVKHSLNKRVAEMRVELEKVRAAA